MLVSMSRFRHVCDSLIIRPIGRTKLHHCVSWRLAPCHTVVNVHSSSIYVAQRRLYSSKLASPSSNLRGARFRRIITISAFSVFFTSAGFVLATAPAIASIVALVSAPTDADSLALYHTADEVAAGINEHINNHPLSRSLRADPAWAESRPHLRYPASQRKHSLTAATLIGPGKIPVPPLVFLEEGKSLVSMSYLSTDLCGHMGIIHGGLLATLLDEGLARCGFSALPNNIGVTANLNVNYRHPAPAGSYVVLKAELTKVEGRKVWVKGRIELLGDTIEPGKLLVEAEALFIEPTYAKYLPKLFANQNERTVSQ